MSLLLTRMFPPHLVRLRKEPQCSKGGAEGLRVLLLPPPREGTVSPPTSRWGAFKGLRPEGPVPSSKVSTHGSLTAGWWWTLGHNDPLFYPRPPERQSRSRAKAAPLWEDESPLPCHPDCTSCLHSTGHTVGVRSFDAAGGTKNIVRGSRRQIQGQDPSSMRAWE